MRMTFWILLRRICSLLPSIVLHSTIVSSESDVYLRNKCYHFWVNNDDNLQHFWSGCFPIEMTIVLPRINTLLSLDSLIILCAKTNRSQFVLTWFTFFCAVVVWNNKVARGDHFYKIKYRLNHLTESNRSDHHWKALETDRRNQSNHSKVMSFWRSKKSIWVDPLICIRIYFAHRKLCHVFVNESVNYALRTCNSQWVTRIKP